MEDQVDYGIILPIYQITCKLCGGELYHHQLGEHLRYATKPDTPSHREEAMALHYWKFQ